jgi:hypothetical protein
MIFLADRGSGNLRDTRNVDGLIGTGSNDIVASDVFVPERRILNFLQMREGRAPGASLYDNPIYKMPMLPFLALTAAIPAALPRSGKHDPSVAPWCVAADSATKFPNPA